MANDPAEVHGMEPISTDVRDALNAGGPTCRAWPEQEEGPYHRDDPPVRRDVVEDAPGSPLVLGVRLVDERGDLLVVSSVEIWHCDALGRYSGFPPPEPAADYVADRM